MKGFGELLLADHEDSIDREDRLSGKKIFPNNRYGADIAVTATCFYNIIGPVDGYETLSSADCDGISAKFMPFRDYVRDRYNMLVEASERLFHVAPGLADIEWADSYERVHWVQITNGVLKHYAVPIVKVVGNPADCDLIMNNLIQAFHLENMGDDPSDTVHWRTGDIYEYNHEYMRRPELTGLPWHDSGVWYSEARQYLAELIPNDNAIECTVQHGQFSASSRQPTKSGGVRTMITPVHVLDIRLATRLPYDEMLASRSTFLDSIRDNFFDIWKLQSVLAGHDQILIEALSTSVAKLNLGDRINGNDYTRGTVRIPVWIDYVGGSSFCRDVNTAILELKSSTRQHTSLHADIEDHDGYPILPGSGKILISRSTTPVPIEVYRDPWPEHYAIKATVEARCASAAEIFYAILRMNWSTCTIDCYPNTRVEPDISDILRKSTGGMEVLS